MSPALLAALIWAAPSYALHVGIHEEAHAWAARQAGCHASVSLIPQRLPDGSIAFGMTTVDAECPASSFFAFAPIVFEMAWSGIISVILPLVPKNHWLRGVLLAELASSTIDVGVWNAGMLRGKPFADGTKYLQMGGAPAVPVLGLLMVSGSLGLGLVGTFQ